MGERTGPQIRYPHGFTDVEVEHIGADCHPNITMLVDISPQMVGRPSVFQNRVQRTTVISSCERHTKVLSILNGDNNLLVLVRLTVANEIKKDMEKLPLWLRSTVRKGQPFGLPTPPRKLREISRIPFGESERKPVRIW